MNRKAELVVLPIVYLVVAKRHIADCKVKEVPPVGSLKSRNRYIRFRVKLFSDSACYVIKLHAVELTFPHTFGKQAKEISDAHRRLQDVAGLKSHIANCFIDRLDYGR